MLFILLIILLGLVALGLWYVFNPQKAYQLHRSMNFNRYFYKNYERLEPNESMFVLIRFSGILAIIASFALGSPFYNWIIPTENKPHIIVDESNQANLSYPVRSKYEFFGIEYTSDDKILTTEQIEEIENRFEKVKLGISFNISTPSSPYFNDHYGYDVFDYVELHVDQGKFVSNNEHTAYFVFEEGHHSFPLRGDFTEVYNYLISIR